MKFYSKKKQRSKTETLLDQIISGKCGDTVIGELMTAIAELTDPEEIDRVVTALVDIALKSASPVAIAYATRALLELRPLPDGVEDELEKRAQELIADKDTMSNKALLEAIAELCYIRISERVSRAGPFVGTLIQILDERSGTDGPMAYNTLMIVAANSPELFQQHSALLNRMLGSINKATRVHTARIIAVLAMSHPEYVAGAEKTLLHLSSFNPDAEVKNSASEAWQILSSRLHTGDRAPEAGPTQRPEQEPSGGLAQIMRRKADVGDAKKSSSDGRINKRLLSMATNFARKADHAYKTEGEASGDEEAESITKIMDDFSEIAQSITAGAGPAGKPAGTEAASSGENPAGMEAASPAMHESPEEAELRRMMAKVKDDFSITAGSLLDAIGMGHLANRPATEDPRPRPEVAVRDRPKRAKLTRNLRARPDQVPEEATSKKVIGEEREVSAKEFIASIESILSMTNVEPEDVAPAPAAASPLPTTAAEGQSIIASVRALVSAEPAPVKEALEPAPAVDVVPPMAWPEPAKALRAEPAKASQPEPSKAVQPEPVMAVQPELIKTPQPELIKTPQPELIKTPQPEPVKASQPEPSKAIQPEPAKGVQPEPVTSLQPVEPVKADEQAKPAKPPVVPPGVRITAMKFKSIDQSKTKKTPVPPKISIKPHIKPLSKPPIDAAKSAQARQYPMAGAPGGQEAVPESPVGHIFCHSCNAKMPDDSQRCAICGSDLKAPKTRCRTCGEINPREASKCARCGSPMDG